MIAYFSFVDPHAIPLPVNPDALNAALPQEVLEESPPAPTSPSPSAGSRRRSRKARAEALYGIDADREALLAAVEASRKKGFRRQRRLMNSLLLCLMYS